MLRTLGDYSPWLRGAWASAVKRAPVRVSCVSHCRSRSRRPLPKSVRPGPRSSGPASVSPAKRQNEMRSETRRERPGYYIVSGRSAHSGSSGLARHCDPEDISTRRHFIETRLCPGSRELLSGTQKSYIVEQGSKVGDCDEREACCPSEAIIRAAIANSTLVTDYTLRKTI